MGIARKKGTPRWISPATNAFAFQWYLILGNSGEKWDQVTLNSPHSQSFQTQPDQDDGEERFYVAGCSKRASPIRKRFCTKRERHKMIYRTPACRFALNVFPEIAVTSVLGKNLGERGTTSGVHGRFSSAAHVRKAKAGRRRRSWDCQIVRGGAPFRVRAKAANDCGARG